MVEHPKSKSTQPRYVTTVPSSQNSDSNFDGNDENASCSRESRNMYNFIAATDDNNARYRCEASNSMSPQPMKAEIVVSVLCECDTIAEKLLHKKTFVVGRRSPGV